MSKKQTFIFTSDKETADKLIEEGFVCIEKSNDGWKFINDQNINFSDNKNIAYTNKLNM